MFPPEADNGFVTVGELVHALPQLALPHFQRGHVWGDSAVSSLLESLMLDTPCGSIILWVPEGPMDDLGEQVPEWGSGSTDPAFLVVDGQQRLTALAEVWRSGRRWALNRAAFAELRAGERRRRVESAQPFVAWPDPPGPDAGRTARSNHEIRTSRLVELSAVVEHGEAAWPDCPDEAVPVWSAMVQGITSLRERTFQVVVKRGRPLPDIVAMYNRINSSGIAVRKEERAFATMVSYEPATPNWLVGCFSDAHPDRVRAGQPDRNALLKRERERLFGFPLFVSGYVQTVGHHLGSNNDLDLLARDDADLRWAGDRVLSQAMLDQSRRLVATTARVLREDLGCDDFRFLPSAADLRPVFSLLLKYPDLPDPLIARALMSVQVNHIEGAARTKDIDDLIRASNTLGQALAALPTTEQLIGSPEGFADRLHRVRSVANSWVSILYWYQRSRGARDYIPIALDGNPPSYLKLGRASDAQKEHVIPFSLLYAPFGLDTRARSGTHEINGIGNLTMLSGAANVEHLNHPVAFDSLPVELLAPHHLDTAPVLAAYHDVLAALERADPERDTAIQDTYLKFLRLRAADLARGMHRWMNEILTHPPDYPATRPAPQLMNPSAADLIRAQPWPRPFQDVLLELNARREGRHWRLHKDPGESTRKHKIRLSDDGAELKIGLRVPGSADLVADLQRHLDRRWEDHDEVHFAIDPLDSRSIDLLRTLVRRAARSNPR